MPKGQILRRSIDLLLLVRNRSAILRRWYQHLVNDDTLMLQRAGADKGADDEKLTRFTFFVLSRTLEAAGVPVPESGTV